MDQKSIAQLQLLHPKLRDIAILAYTQAINATPVNVHPVIDQTYRTFAESDALYAQGRTTKGEIVTNAKAGQSYHNYALAIDFHLIVDGRDSWDVDHNWMTVVNIFKQHSFTWGGEFSTGFVDNPHLENKFGHNWRDLLALHDAGKFIPGTTYVLL